MHNEPEAGIAASGSLCMALRALEAAGDAVERVADVAAEQGQRRHANNGDQRQDQAVLGQALALFVTTRLIRGGDGAEEKAIDQRHCRTLPHKYLGATISLAPLA